MLQVLPIHRDLIYQLQVYTRNCCNLQSVERFRKGRARTLPELGFLPIQSIDRTEDLSDRSPNCREQEGQPKTKLRRAVGVARNSSVAVVLRPAASDVAGSLPPVYARRI